MMRTVRFNKISKLSLLAALLSALFASCKDDNEDETVVDRRNPNSNVISFSTYTAGATRGTVVDAADIKKNGFYVSAWYDSRLHFKDGASYTEVINGDKIFDTEATYYWPTLSADKSIDFRAFNISSGGDWVDGNCNSIKFDVKETASAQKDLVVAYASATSRPDQGVQPLNFIHALSKINFSFTGADPEYTYTINRVEVIAAGKKEAGNPEFKIGETNLWSFDAITTVDHDNPLVNSTGAAQGVLYTYYNSADSTVKDGTVVNGQTETPFNANFMLLPQTGKIAIRVYYKVEDDGGNLLGNCGYSKTDGSGNHGVEDGVYGCKTLIVNLGEVIKDEHNNPLGWQAGKSYRFIITLPTDNFLGDTSGDGVADESDEGQTEDYDGDGDEDKSEFGTDKYIEFAVKVTPWGDGENVPATIIIK